MSGSSSFGDGRRRRSLSSSHEVLVESPVGSVSPHHRALPLEPLSPLYATSSQPLPPLSSLPPSPRSHHRARAAYPRGRSRHLSGSERDSSTANSSAATSPTFHHERPLSFELAPLSLASGNGPSSTTLPSFRHAFGQYQDPVTRSRGIRLTYQGEPPSPFDPIRASSPPVRATTSGAARPRTTSEMGQLPSIEYEEYQRRAAAALRIRPVTAPSIGSRPDFDLDAYSQTFARDQGGSSQANDWRPPQIGTTRCCESHPQRAPSYALTPFLDRLGIHDTDHDGSGQFQSPLCPYGPGVDVPHARTKR